MKILIFSESLLFKTRDGTIYGQDPWILNVRNISLIEEVEVGLLSPVSEIDSQEPPQGHWAVPVDNIKMFHLAPYCRYIEFWKEFISRPRKLMMSMHRAVRWSDCVILRGPSPATTPFCVLSSLRKKPLIFFILMDLASQPDGLYHPNPIKRGLFKIAIFLLLVEETFTSKLSRFVIPYNGEIERRLGVDPKKVVRMQDPHVSSKDIRFRSPRHLDRVQQIRVVRVAWLIPSKGIEYLIRAIAILRKKRIDVALTIVGDERRIGYRESLEALVAELGVSDYVEFLGWVAHCDIYDCYFEADIHVLSSLSEGTPRCILEGMSQGALTVATRVGSVEEELVDGETALIIEPSDEYAIASAILRLRNEPRLREKLSTGGFEYASMNTFEASASKLRKVFRESFL